MLAGHGDAACAAVARVGERTQAKGHGELPSDEAMYIGQKTKGVSRSAKQNFKSEVGDVWQLVAAATPEEAADVRQCVLQLATSKGRAQLIEKYGAKMESADAERSHAGDMCDADGDVEAKLNPFPPFPRVM